MWCLKTLNNWKKIIFNTHVCVKENCFNFDSFACALIKVHHETQFFLYSQNKRKCNNRNVFKSNLYSMMYLPVVWNWNQSKNIVRSICICKIIFSTFVRKWAHTGFPIDQVNVKADGLYYVNLSSINNEDKNLWIIINRRRKEIEERTCMHHLAVIVLYRMGKFSRFMKFWWAWQYLRKCFVWIITSLGCIFIELFLYKSHHCNLMMSVIHRSVLLCALV